MSYHLKYVWTEFIPMLNLMNEMVKLLARFSFANSSKSVFLRDVYDSMWCAGQNNLNKYSGSGCSLECTQ